MRVATCDPTLSGKCKHGFLSESSLDDDDDEDDDHDEVLTGGSSGTRVTGARTGGMREWRGHPLRSQRIRRSGPSLPQPLHKTDNVARMIKSS